MEGDAKGQVGGMEMPQKERERLADESRIWKCHGCGGRSNQDILREEGGEASKGKQTEPVVPAEMKFGFRDQMEKPESEKAPGTTVEQPLSAIPSTSSNSQTSDVSAVSQVSPDSRISQPSSTPMPLQPTRTVPASLPLHAAQATPLAERQEQSNGVPPWVDKAITGVTAALAIMVCKKILV